MAHSRRRAAVARHEAPSKGPAGLVGVPVETDWKAQALRGFQPHRDHVVDEHQEGGGVLDAELLGLLDRVDQVRPCIGEGDHVGVGGLRLQQRCRHVGCRQGMLRASDDPAAPVLHGPLHVVGQIVPEGVVGLDQIPGLGPGAEQGTGR